MAGLREEPGVLPEDLQVFLPLPPKQRSAWMSVLRVCGAGLTMSVTESPTRRGLSCGGLAGCALAAVHLG